MSTELIVWAALLVLFIIIEAITAQLVTIWFAAGALAAVIASLLKAPLWLEIVLFIAVSAVTLIATRPLVKKYISGKAQPTNSDRFIGKCGVVTTAIDNTDGVGIVKVEGSEWSARSADGSPIEEGRTVEVLDIKGVKLIVK